MFDQFCEGMNPVVKDSFSLYLKAHYFDPERLTPGALYSQLQNFIGLVALEVVRLGSVYRPNTPVGGL